MQKTIPLHPRAAPPGTPGPWRLARLLTAPHRLGFFGAALGLALTGLWWLAVMATRALGEPLPWAVAPPLAHGLAMAFAFMPLFIVGFLFTAGPKWLGMPEVPARLLLRPVLALGGGMALAMLGFHSSHLIAAIGLGLMTLGWAALLHRFVRLLRASPVPDRLHATGVAVAGGVGLLAMAGATLGLALQEPTWTRAATQAAVWGFLAPTFAIVSHRMIPFFTAAAVPSLDAWKPNWLLGAMALALTAAALGEVGAAWVGPLPARVHAALALVMAPAAVLMLWLAVRWGLVQSLRIRLLAMLHGGFLWLGMAWALLAASHALSATGAGPAPLGLAPLHALTVGYLGATLLAMVTRVAAGHSGRPLAADNLAWALYWTLQLAAVLRLAAVWWPQAMTALLLAALYWAVAAAGWAWRYGQWLGRPRVDGRPG